MIRTLPFQLTAENLACHRGGRLVFEGVNFAVGPGEWLDLRGPNGSGKSTLLRLLAGLSEPAEGKLSLDERAQHVHFIAHGDAFKTALTVRENLTFWSQFLNGAKDDIEKALPHFGLTALADTPAAILSAGQRRRLSLTRLKLARRPIWLLDEPSVGLDDRSIAQLRSIMNSHLATGGLVVAATHVDLGLEAGKRLDLKGAP